MNQYKLTNNRQYSYFTLTIFMLICGLLSLALGKDLDWDLANYHYYNVFAFLNDRYDKDFWPAAFNTYLNPTLDFLTYFLIHTFPPKLVGFLYGAIHGIAVWLVYKIALLYLPHQKTSYYIAIIIAILGAYCPQFISGLGMSLGDITSGIFILASIYFLAKTLFEQIQPSMLLLSGIFLGLGLGLKLTNELYFVGSLLALFIIYITRQTEIHLRSILYWTIGAGAGFAIISGYWMYFLWNQFHNPVFPFFNSIFHSPYFPEINWKATQFFPKTRWEWLFYPFIFAFSGLRVDDVFFADMRFALLYALFVLIALKSLLNLFNHQEKIAWSPPEKWLILFFLFSYIFWEITFSFLRYAVILEMLVPLLIFVLIKKMTTRLSLQIFAIATSFSVITLFSMTLPAERGPWTTETYFGFEIPTHLNKIDKALVLLPIPNYQAGDAAPLSLAYMIPFFSSSWHFAGVPYPNANIDMFTSKIKKIISEHSGPIFLLAAKDNMATFRQVLANYQLNSNNDCKNIPIAQGLRRDQKVFLCELTKS